MEAEKDKQPMEKKADDKREPSEKDMQFSKIKEQPLKNQETLAYREMSPRDPKSFRNAIFLHDALMSSNLWRIDDFMSRMQPMLHDFHVYAPDFRGFGHSSYKNKLASFDDFVDDIDMFMDALDMKEALFVGDKFGGFISQLFSMRHPEKSLGMILMNPHTMHFPPMLQGDMMDKVKTKKELMENKEYKSINDSLMKHDREFMRDMMKDMKGKTHFEDLIDDSMRTKCLEDLMWCESVFEEAEEDDTKLAGQKALLISGDKDKEVPKEASEELAKKMGPSATNVTMKDQPHHTWLNKMGMDSTIKRMEEFMKSL